MISQTRIAGAFYNPLRCTFSESLFVKTKIRDYVLSSKIEDQGWGYIGIPPVLKTDFRGFRINLLHYFHHGHPTVKATDVHHLSGSNRVAAAGALIFSAVGFLGGSGCGCSSTTMSSRTSHGNAEVLIAVNENIGQSIFQHKV